jgi:hypothetical protein
MEEIFFIHSNKKNEKIENKLKIITFLCRPWQDFYAEALRKSKRVAINI